PNIVGPPLWNSAFLPGVFQGTFISTKETDPEKLIPYLRNEKTDLIQQREELDLLAKLNQKQLEQLREPDPNLEAAIQSMEIAYRMQTEAPEVFDIRKESETTRQRYGDSEFAKGCLMALRLVEHGVRVIQLYFAKGNPWDHHDDILQHQKLAR